MFHVILYEPEIPPNTGNIIRLCANTGSTLHLIEPLGFPLDDKRMKRAGLDYHEFANIQVHSDLKKCLTYIQGSLYAFTTKTTALYTDVNYQPGDALLFGPETRGLPEEVRAQSHCVRLPMLPDSRSLNLSNSVAVAVYEAWRQNHFSLAAPQNVKHT
jgi:tRNA (cytidine/uridine-2'-O-)-methyltransferase